MILFNANKAVRPEDAVGHGVGGNTKVATGVYTLTAALTQGQVIPMVAVPAGARVLDVTLSADDLDGGAGLALDVGDGADADRYLAASTVAQGGGVARLSTHAGHGYRYAAGDTIDVTVQTAPAAGATSGSLKLSVLFVID